MNIFMKYNNKKKSIFSRNLIRIRKEKGLSQKELADLAGLSQRMIVYYECESGNPPIEKIQKIANALKVNPNDLLLEDKTKIVNNDFSEMNTKTIKKIKQILELSPDERHLVYSYVDSLLSKKKQKQHQDSQK